MRKSGKTENHWQDGLYHDTAMIAVVALKNLGRERQAEMLAKQYHISG